MTKPAQAMKKIYTPPGVDPETLDDPYPDDPPRKRSWFRDLLYLIGAALVALGVIASRL